MNRSLDYRTDFYSLGVTLYELLTHERPFKSPDALEMVHCHIAKHPIPPHEIRPEIPKMISDILLRLMAKNAEDRYQSTIGLKRDLQRCLDDLTSAGMVSPFDIGAEDVSATFQISEKLYGRDAEISALMQAFARASSGPSELMMVAGYSGVGKSALIHEIHKPVTEKMGYFISGKFDQFQRDVPYHAFIQSVESLVTLLLSETEKRLAAWRKNISAAVGNVGKVLTDIIPNLEQIIGPQPDIPELSPVEARHRLNYVLGKFIRAICQKPHPIALVLDDLQWADSASLNLIRTLMDNPENRYLLIISAYRDNEVSPTHPALLSDLEWVTLRVDMAAVNEVIEDIRTHDTNLGESLAKLANNFDYGKILALIREYKALPGS
ncbi:MAG: hypothetical protein B6245_12230 [Desulfobacteraceae bacterium 4572_88]|nr:MAG: hypothetical protein B6245_12230 [Desulfobacteraceae bacterium 4572_88]